ncbi:MAG TPA: ABC transporter permease [Acidobacteriota bacterium]
MQGWWVDLKFSWRMLRQRPAISLVAVTAIAVAIGSTSTMFSVVNALLLEPLPFKDSGRLVGIWEVDPAAPDNWRFASQGSFSDWRRLSRSFERLVAGRNRSFTLTSFEDGDTPLMREISHGYFETLGVQPLLGRTFRADEDRAGGPAVMLLSYELWQRRFGADPDIVGRSTELDGRPFEIVGVIPAEHFNPLFGLDVRPQAWIPLALPEGGLDRTDGGHLVMARLKPAVRLEQAADELRRISTVLAEQYPDTHSAIVAKVTGLAEPITRRARPGILLLFGAVVFVLLVACGNVANLLLTRALERHREIAIRRALGAGTAQLVRQLLTESVVLGLLGGTLGLLLAYWGSAALPRLLPRGPGVPSFDFPIDISVLLFTFGISILTGLVFGLAPAAQALRLDLESALRSGAGRLSADSGKRRLRGALVVGEMALSLMLLIGAGLTIRSFNRLQGLDPGFDPRSMLTLRVSTRGPDYEEGAQREAFYRKVVEGVATIPGVEAVGAAQFMPFFSVFGEVPATLDAGPALEPGTEPRVLVRRATPGFLEAMRIPLLRGRSIDDRDVAGAPNVALVSRTMAQRLWGERDPIGASLTLLDGAGVSRRVVGIVGDVRSAQSPPLPHPIVYLPLAQDPAVTSMSIVLRTRGAPLSFLGAVERQVRAIDRSMPVYFVMTMRQMLDNMDGGSRTLTTLLSVFASLAVLLAVSGLYAVLSYLVSQRTKEIGIRVALGAGRAAVIGMVLRSGLSLAALGIAAGLAGALALSRLLESQLYGVTATDPAIYAGLCALMFATVLIASALPALRAVRIDPIRALREE